MKAHRWVLTLAIILVALNVLDILTTTAALSVGCKESNGFTIFLFTTFGFTVAIIIKLGAATLVGYLAFYSHHLDCRALRTILTIGLLSMVLLYVAVLCNNITALFFATRFFP